MKYGILTLKGMICSVMVIASLVKFSVGQTLLTYEFNNSLAGSNILSGVTASDMVIAPEAAGRSAVYLFNNDFLRIDRHDDVLGSLVSSQPYFGDAFASLSFTLTAAVDTTLSVTGMGGLQNGGIVNYHISQQETGVTSTVTGNSANISLANSVSDSVTFATPFTIQGGESATFYLRLNSGSITGAYDLTSFSIQGNSVSAVPEPSTYLLLFLGLIGFVIYQKRSSFNSRDLA